MAETGNRGSGEARSAPGADAPAAFPYYPHAKAKTPWDLALSRTPKSRIVRRSVEEVNQLHSRTEGWAAGLRLLATSLAQLPGNRTALLQGELQSSRRIFDFLAEEVLDQQEPDLRSFLLETSILSVLRPEVCDALTVG
jgi:ATP/maltotriose-dependent transcriptional regulator MalT